ncbi:type IV secretion system protein [Phenylobacterium sp.]|jgi:type IV secretion system protein VirB5|uniref:type IV secretion system protein n=1 Tax=Phenylobacterium sp. TaxID=1871053 RepID=UPI002F425A81
MTRRILAAGAAALALMASAAQAQEIVYDPTNYGKLIEQAETGLKQLQQLQSQVQQAQRLYDGFNQASGVNGLATLLESPQLRAVLPDATTFVSAANGDLAALGQIGARAGQIRSATRVYTAATPDAASQALDASGNRAALSLALGESVADAGSQRLAGLQQLQASLAAAPDARAVMDLQARLTAEQAMIANDQMKLQGLAMTQAAQDRLAAQQQQERAAAASDARLQAYKAAFQ